MTGTLEAWLARQYEHSGKQMLRGISRTDLVKHRPGFGQSIRAAAGSVVASPVLADWNPEPDYFFHWFRDSALVIDALRLLYEDGQIGAQALTMVRDFVAFSAALKRLDGRVSPPDWRARVAESFQQYLREEGELQAVRGQQVVADTRVNADGTLDISRWSRPQHDGAPLRALALLRWWPHLRGDAMASQVLAQLLRDDLAFVLAHWHEPAFDMWEEESGRHYHTLRVSAAALERGAAWLEEGQGEGQSASGNTIMHAQTCHRAAQQIRLALDALWLPEAQHYASREAMISGADDSKLLDISVILAAIHACDGSSGPHTPGDPRMHATLERLMALFSQHYAINHRGRAGPAMGRYRGDHYFSGGAYYFSTLGAAELCFRAARVVTDAKAADWHARGDAFLNTVREFTPPSGDLSEQFDQRTGAQTSARHLTWSYAAFISCFAARRAAITSVRQ